MSETEYPEIQALEKMLLRHRIRLKKTGPGLGPDQDQLAIALHIDQQEFRLYLEDEYRDWDEANPAMCLCLALRELEEYEEEEDYLTWCTARGYEAGDEKIRSYHMDLRHTYAAVEKLLGKIDSPISDWDFEMNAGVAQALRKLGSGS